MSELPRTDELPRSEDGYDAARVEEAFASFAERVHELEAVAGELRAELHALRAARRPGGGEREARPYEPEEWPIEAGPTPAGSAPAPDWIASVPSPLTRPITVPRLVLEAVFLVLVALFAGLADLSPTTIVILMASAWALVALSEWVAAAKRAHWRLDAVAPPAEAPGAAGESTGPWSAPVVQATVVETPDVSESHTVVTKLPAPAEAEAEPEDTGAMDVPEVAVAPSAAAEAGVDEAAGGSPIPPAEPDADAEQEPRRRRWFRRRRSDDQEPAPDPWEI